MLKRGQCLIRVNSVEKPFAMETEYVKRSWLSDDEILENNKAILERSRKQEESQNDIITVDVKQPKLKMFCKFCGKDIEQNTDNCVQCSTTLKEKDKEIKEFDEFIEELFLAQSRDEFNKDDEQE